MRYNLVPKMFVFKFYSFFFNFYFRISEKTFWNNYFYRISLVKKLLVKKSEESEAQSVSCASVEDKPLNSSFDPLHVENNLDENLKAGNTEKLKRKLICYFYLKFNISF